LAPGTADGFGRLKSPPGSLAAALSAVASRVTDSVFLIDTVALGSRKTVAAYVLKGSKIALVDCGYASSAETVLGGLLELGIPPSEVDYLVPTHVHLDHAGAAGYLLPHMPKAKVIAQERGVPHLVDPTRLIDSATRVFGKEFIDAYGRPTAIERERILPVGEELHVDLGGISFTAIHSPGHAPHQISVFVEREKVLVSADAVGIVYPSLSLLIPTTPPPSLDPLELGRTTGRLAQLDARTLLAPHFGVRTDVAAVLEETRTRTDEWVARVRSLRNAGSSLDEVSAALRKDVVAQSGIEEASLPTYADISIRASAMGILHYLEKNP
jgi:glyoxylase-like metal-dependent hydrolase (beta-lactamase superfamily II)